MLQQPKKVEGLEWSEVEGGLVAYHPASDRIHFLNHTGALVLELCNGRHSVPEIVNIVQAAFKLERAPEAEVSDVLRQALDAGLVTDDPGAPTAAPGEEKV